MTLPEPEAVVAGKYRVIRALGEGGMGAVFEVENIVTGKREALKWLHPRFRSNEEVVKRMVHEARAMARVRHRNVVDVYDVVVDDDNVCLVMERLEGELLSDRIARGQLYVDELIEILLPAMSGVSAAHAVGVVHRDIKPENIFMSVEPGEPSPVPKIIDFGISKVFDVESGQATRSGVTMGTPKYVSYEQLRGARDVDARTDVYAFGVILYEALTGRAPYEAKTFGEQAIQFLTSEPPRVLTLCPQAPERLAMIVERAVAREREGRPSLEQLMKELSLFVHLAAYRVRLGAFPQSPSTATTSAPLCPLPTKPDESRLPSARRAIDSAHPTRSTSASKAAALAAGALAMAILFLLIAMLRTKDRPPTADAPLGGASAASSAPTAGAAATSSGEARPAMPPGTLPTAVPPQTQGATAATLVSEPVAQTEPARSGASSATAVDAGEAPLRKRVRRRSPVHMPADAREQPDSTPRESAQSTESNSEREREQTAPEAARLRQPEVEAARAGPLQRTEF